MAVMRIENCSIISTLESAISLSSVLSDAEEEEHNKSAGGSSLTIQMRGHSVAASFSPALHRTDLPLVDIYSEQDIPELSGTSLPARRSEGLELTRRRYAT